VCVALAGNPNSGKTTIFNNLTGARHHVGNYPGVTVERREGVYQHKGLRVATVDLPGTYSLAAYSIDEVIARDFIVGQRPDVVVAVVDATNLERHLYLTVEILELGAAVVLALNMSDEAEAGGLRIDSERLSHLLGVSVVRTVGNRGKGTEELRAAVNETALRGAVPEPLRVDYGAAVEAAVSELEALAETVGDARLRFGVRWLALKRLEQDDEVTQWFEGGGVGPQAERVTAELEATLGDTPEAAIAQRRYEHIHRVCGQVLDGSHHAARTPSDRIDRIVSHRILGLPIFLALMYGVFQLVFTLGEVPMGWIESGVHSLGVMLSGLWPAGADSPLRSLVIDGIVSGVGGVIVFVPNIALLFLAIALLENSGYMARAAFIMDGFMHRLGLHGKSFIPLLTGFGCTVPAIMATRTLGNTRDRLITMLVAPLMSCGARLPIYALIIPAFFPEQWRGPMLWLIYVIGIALAVLCSKLLGTTLFRGSAAPFIMELPPYRVPTACSVALHVWERAGLYLRKAGTIILGASILVWACTSYPKPPAGDTADGEAAAAYSIAGRVGHAMEPVLRPIGFDWRVGTSLLGAFAAKEVFVAQMGIVFSLGDADGHTEALRARLRHVYTPLQGFCIMLFCLIGSPCMATLATTRRETDSWWWPLFQTGALTALAYLVTLVVYQAGMTLGVGVG